MGEESVDSNAVVERLKISLSTTTLLFRRADALTTVTNAMIVT